MRAESCFYDSIIHWLICQCIEQYLLKFFSFILFLCTIILTYLHILVVYGIRIELNLTSLKSVGVLIRCQFPTVWLVLINVVDTQITDAVENKVWASMFEIGQTSGPKWSFSSISSWKANMKLKYKLEDKCLQSIMGETNSQGDTEKGTHPLHLFNDLS